MQALDINTNYLVLRDDATRKMSKLFEMLFIVWITVHILVHLVGSLCSCYQTVWHTVCVTLKKEEPKPLLERVFSSQLSH